VYVDASYQSLKTILYPRQGTLWENMYFHLSFVAVIIFQDIPHNVKKPFVSTK